MKHIGRTVTDPRAPRARWPLLAIGCMASAFVLITSHASPSLRAQQPAGAAGPAGPAAEKKADAPKPAANAADDAARAEATQMGTRVFRAVFLSELRFIRAASGASEEQTRRMARAVREPLRSVVADCVEAALKAKREKNDGREFDWHGAYRTAHDKLAAIAREQLSREQWSRVEAQTAKRKEHRKRVVLGSLLAGLDDELVLTAGQLEKLEESLSSHWDPRWETEDVIDRPRPFPALPDPLIVPVLTDSQKAAWTKLKKRAVGRGEFQWVMVIAELAEMTSPAMAQKDDLESELAAAPAAKR